MINLTVAVENRHSKIGALGPRDIRGKEDRGGNGHLGDRKGLKAVKRIKIAKAT